MPRSSKIFPAGTPSNTPTPRSLTESVTPPFIQLNLTPVKPKVKPNEMVHGLCSLYFQYQSFREYEQKIKFMRYWFVRDVTNLSGFAKDESEIVSLSSLQDINKLSYNKFTKYLKDTSLSELTQFKSDLQTALSDNGVNEKISDQFLELKRELKKINTAWRTTRDFYIVFSEDHDPNLALSRDFDLYLAYLLATRSDKLIILSLALLTPQNLQIFETKTAALLEQYNAFHKSSIAKNLNPDLFYSLNTISASQKAKLEEPTRMLLRNILTKMASIQNEHKMIGGGIAEERNLFSVTTPREHLSNKTGSASVTPTALPSHDSRCTSPEHKTPSSLPRKKSFTFDRDGQAIPSHQLMGLPSNSSSLTHETIPENDAAFIALSTKVLDKIREYEAKVRDRYRFKCRFFNGINRQSAHRLNSISLINKFIKKLNTGAYNPTENNEQKHDGTKAGALRYFVSKTIDGIRTDHKGKSRVVRFFKFFTKPRLAVALDEAINPKIKPPRCC